MINLTDDGSGPPPYDCARNSSQPGPDGHMRCEFIYYESESPVNYRGLKYHSASF